MFNSSPTKRQPGGLTRRHILTCPLAVGLACEANAQSYPNRQITMLVGFPAGGQADALARVLQPALQRAIGQPVIVDNAAGVGGSLGAQKALAAGSEGYTVYFGTPIELVQTPMAVATVKYKPEDFRMVGLMGSSYLMMLVRKDLPVTNVAEFIALSKRPGQRELSYGSVGKGSVFHLAAERFANDTGAKLLHIPYKGAQQLIPDLAAGQIDMAFMPLGGSIPGLLKTGRFKAIGYAGPTRHRDYPDVQTMNESKVVKDFQFDLWVALMVPRKTPDGVVQKLSSAFQDALNNPQVRRDVEASGGILAGPMTPAQASRFYASEILRYQSIAKAIKLSPE